MVRDDAVYVEHMLATAARAVQKAEGVDLVGFLDDENLHLACVYLVQVIGEAAARVSPETRARFPSIPWRQIVGMRHRLVHDYLEVDLEVVWAVLTKDFPPLLKVLRTPHP